MDNQEKILRSMREVHHKFSRLFTRILGEVDLTLPQYALLNLLVNSGDIPMTEVSKKLYITKPAVTHLVDRLARQKMMARKPHPTDRRIYLLQILPKGKALVSRVEEQFIINVGVKTITHFKERDKKLIEDFFATISRNVDGLLAHEKTK